MDVFSINDIYMHIPKHTKELRNTISQMLNEGEKSTISFINPEIFVEAENNINLKEYLLSTKYNFIDGIGLLEAFNFYFKKCSFSFNDRYPGTDFFEYLPLDRDIKIFFLGASRENCQNAKVKISNKYKNINIVDFVDGYSEIEDDLIINKINNLDIDIVIVCLGCPKQELWIKNNIEKIHAKIVFGNGGAIDFWSGNVKRAPSFFIRNKMEWLYRLSQDFSVRRIRRQLKLIMFVVAVILKKYEIKRIN